MSSSLRIDAYRTNGAAQLPSPHDEREMEGAQK
jgi:hypothetical protein